MESGYTDNKQPVKERIAIKLIAKLSEMGMFVGGTGRRARGYLQHPGERTGHWNNQPIAGTNIGGHPVTKTFFTGDAKTEPISPETIKSRGAAWSHYRFSPKGGVQRIKAPRMGGDHEGDEGMHSVSTRARFLHPEDFERFTGALAAHRHQGRNPEFMRFGDEIIGGKPTGRMFYGSYDPKTKNLQRFRNRDVWDPTNPKYQEMYKGKKWNPDDYVSARFQNDPTVGHHVFDWDQDEERVKRYHPGHQVLQIETIIMDNKKALMEQIANILISHLKEDLMKDVQARLAPIKSEEKDFVRRQDKKERESGKRKSEDDDRDYKRKKRELKLKSKEDEIQHKRHINYNDPKRLGYMDRLAKISARMDRKRAETDRYKMETDKKKYSWGKKK